MIRLTPEELEVMVSCIDDNLVATHDEAARLITEIRTCWAEREKTKKALDLWLRYAESVVDGFPEATLDKRLEDAVRETGALYPGGTK